MQVRLDRLAAMATELGLEFAGVSPVEFVISLMCVSSQPLLSLIMKVGFQG